MSLNFLTFFSDRKEITIFTDEGRFCRPLLIIDNETGELRIKKKDVTNLKLNFETITLDDEAKIDSVLKWEDLVTGGLRVIEYLDTAEVESTRIAFTVENIYEQSDLKRDILESQRLRNSTQRLQDQLSRYIKYTHCEIHPR